MKVQIAMVLKRQSMKWVDPYCWIVLIDIPGTISKIKISYKVYQRENKHQGVQLGIDRVLACHLLRNLTSWKFGMALLHDASRCYI